MANLITGLSQAAAGADKAMQQTILAARAEYYAWKFTGMTKAQIMAQVPSFQLGGVVPLTGPALLHKGETVVPAGGKPQAPLVIELGGRQIAKYLIRVVGQEIHLEGA